VFSLNYEDKFRFEDEFDRVENKKIFEVKVSKMYVYLNKRKDNDK